MATTISSLAGRLAGWAARVFQHRFSAHVAVVVLLFVPHVFGSALDRGPFHFGLPAVSSGDEPHYLVFLHSLIEDHDLDLSNNYRSVHEGSTQAGRNFAKFPLDHHSIWLRGEQKVYWYNVYDRRPETWKRDASGVVEPIFWMNASPSDAPQPGEPELPWNFPGLAILLAPFVYVARHTPYVEPLALAMSGIAVVVSTVFFRMLAATMTSDRRAMVLAMAFAFLGTPIWHYGRSLFAESFIECFVLGAFALGIARGRWGWAGLLLGAAVFVKPLSLVLGVPLGALLMFERRWKEFGWLCISGACGCVLLLLTNQAVYGGLFRVPADYTHGDFLISAFQILLSPIRGLVAVAPIAVLGLAGLWTRHRTALVVQGAVVLMFVVNAGYGSWHGGHCYGVRYMVPVLPMACLGLLPILANGVRGVASPFRILGLVGAFSILVNAFAAIHYWRSFAHHPLQEWFSQYY